MSEYLTGRWLRECQECGHESHYPKPANDGIGEQSDAFCNKACKKCGSEALDMGQAEMTEAGKAASLAFMEAMD